MSTLELAIANEINSITVYEGLAEKISLPCLKSLFISMAHDAQHHLEVISALLENPGKIIVYQPDLESLSRIFETIVDAQGLEGVSRDVVAGCHQAMKNEEIVLRNYEELLCRVQSSTTKTLFCKIVEQEKKHLSVIKDLCILISEQQSST
jgi:rubrerythrin